MLPAISRENVGTLTPDDLMGAIDLFNANYSAWQADG